MVRATLVVLALALVVFGASSCRDHVQPTNVEDAPGAVESITAPNLQLLDPQAFSEPSSVCRALLAAHSEAQAEAELEDASQETIAIAAALLAAASDVCS